MTARSRRPRRNARARLFKEQNGLCIFCERPMRIVRVPPGKRQPKDLATLEHVDPLGKGGIFAPSKNCALSCSECNGRRGTMDFQAFKALVQAEQRG